MHAYIRKCRIQFVAVCSSQLAFPCCKRHSMLIKTNTSNYLEIVFELVQRWNTMTNRQEKQKSFSVQTKSLQATLAFSMTTGKKTPKTVPNQYTNLKQSSSINSACQILSISRASSRPHAKVSRDKIGHILSQVLSKLLMLTFCEARLTHARTHIYKRTPCGMAGWKGLSNLSVCCQHALLSLRFMTCTQRGIYPIISL